MRKPKKLKHGDKIGIVSTSFSTKPEAIDQMARYFEQRGYCVEVGPHVLASFGEYAGTTQERADDFNLMVRDPSVRMIMTSHGGAGADQLLPLIDYDAISLHPKIIVGLSDPSVILNSVSCTASVPTFHGPNGHEFGGDDPLTSFTERNFWRLVSENITLPYAFPIRDDVQVVRQGAPEQGLLYGGNMEVVRSLFGTPWEPNWTNVILFLEDVVFKVYRFDRMLTHYRNAGVFGRIKGLVVGQPVECEKSQYETLEDVVLRVCANYDFPILTGLPIGHTDDKITLPIGCIVRLDSSKPSLELLECPTIIE